MPEQHADLVRYAPAVLYACRADELWTGLEVSPGLSELAQLSAARWVADPDAWLRLVHPDDRSRLLRARIDAMSTGELDCTYRIQCADDRTVWIQDEARCRDGRVFGLLRDVTKDHRAGDVMTRLHTSTSQELERLQRHDAARSAFVRTFVHDVRSALRQAKVLVGSQDGRSGDETLQSILGTLYNLVDDLLVVGGLEPGDGLVRPQPVPLGALAEAAIREADPEGRTTVEDTVGEAVVDPVVVRRVLVNLVGNAIGHNPPGTQVRVHIIRTNGDVALTVEDDGAGIPEGERERIFEPYVRLSDGACGWGIGLSLVQQLVELHGGRIWVDDVPGGGASFNVLLPEGRSEAPQHAPDGGDRTSVPATELGSDRPRSVQR